MTESTMGISLLTAMILVNNKDSLIFEAYEGKGKDRDYWAGCITLEDGRPLVSSSPYFGSQEEAIAHMETLVVSLEKALPPRETVH